MFGSVVGQSIYVFPLYQEFTSRDLLQRRITKPTQEEHVNSTGDDNSMTCWVDSPLISAARHGGICVLDGIDKVDVQSLYVLRTLLQDGTISLPSGEQLTMNATDPRYRIHPSFRVVALGLLPKPTQSDECRDKWISSSLGFMYYSFPLDNASKMCERAWALEAADGHSNMTAGGRLIQSLWGGNKYFECLRSVVAEFKNAKVDHPELQLSMRQIIRAARIARMCENRRLDSAATRVLIFESLERLLLVRYLPSISRAKFYSLTGSTEDAFKTAYNTQSSSIRRNPDELSQFIEVNTAHNTLRIGAVTVPRRSSNIPEKVPKPLFYHSPTHDRNLEALLQAWSDGERALLVIGNQGVGKNKLVDRLLQLMNAEREYVQLHRESTVQSLTVLPSLENGRIIYQDSPLIRAAKEGRVLVVDEADKAPVEVVSVLKSLAEDGEVHLYDGRRLLSQKRYDIERTQMNSDQESADVIVIHPAFQLFVLANRPGFPFLGNNLFRECGDVFSVHVVENLDLDSEVTLLQAYGPNVSVDTITKLAQSFADLREAQEVGQLMYPFSVREAVSVVKHIQAYPDDSVASAIECVIAFDTLTPRLRAQIVKIFNDRGIKIPLSSTDEAWKLFRGKLDDETIRDRVFQDYKARPEGSPSTPRTGLNAPKHGKEDAKNEPHVGGNTWAGGTGGSDTAGLGGHGGPYRLDKGHTLHQVSDEMKNQVSQEAKEQAKRMAAEALANRLKEIAMGKTDYKTFINFKAKVDREIDQLRTVFDELSRRSKERVWLRHQSQGDLDDAKLVDGMTGERMVFKRRGYPESVKSLAAESSGEKIIQKKLQFVVDVSASMYRFNGLDRRLERMLEAMLMVLEALPASCNDDSLIDYAISGHAGSSASIKFVEFGNNKPNNEKEKLNILESMAAHTQYTVSGDNTLPAIRKMVRKLADMGKDDSTSRYCFVITDANFDMYGIAAEDVAKAMTTDPKVAVHLIMIASLQEEAERLAQALPANRVHICYQSTDLPALFRNILTSTLDITDT